MTLKLWTCGALLCASIGAHAAADMDEQVFPLLQAIQRASAVTKPESPTAGTIDSIRRQITDLTSTLSQLPGGTPPPYAAAFASYTEAFNRIGTDVESSASRSELSEIAQDVALKATFSKYALGIAVQEAALVKVTVKTMRQGKEVPGFLVRSNPRRYGEREPAFYPFNVPTPVQDVLPPGVYRVFAVAAGKVVAAQDATIGLGGQSTAEVVLLVP